jgi:hypothetical protein
MAKLLSDSAVEEAARALNSQLRTWDCNGKPPDKRRRQAAAEIATAVPLIAADLPWLLRAGGPEVEAAVRAQASGTVGSAAGAGVEGLAPSVMLSATEAARMAGVSDRAVRAACAEDRLAASKSKVSGEWRIAPAALEHWRRTRSAA